MDNEKIIMEKDGKEIECDVLFTFDSPDTGKVYIGYTDHSIAENGRKNIYVSSYDPILGTGTLENITDKDEIDMVNEVLKQIERDYR